MSWFNWFAPEPAIRQEQFAEPQVQAEDRLALQRELVYLVKCEAPIPQALLTQLGVRVRDKPQVHFVLKPENYGCDDRARQAALNAAYNYTLASK